MVGLPLATSAGYAAITCKVVLVGQILVGTGTSTLGSFEVIPPGQTNAGTSVTPPSSIGALAELRRLSGLSWDQLARIFSVSRRALHFWASGKPMARTNEEKLQRVLAVVRDLDRGSVAANRAALLEMIGAADPTAELGARERTASVAARLGDAARQARRPPPPAELVAARHDSVHRDRGPARSIRTVKVKPEK